MPIEHIAGYKFIPLNELNILGGVFLDHCRSLELKGTILLSEEGVNINLAGPTDAIHSFKTWLEQDERFADMTFRESRTENFPYQRLKVKIKGEIITLRQPDIQAADSRAPSIEPETLKRWLDENREITLLDTRNDYEVRFGTFVNALNLNLEHFCEFPSAIEKIERDKPVVMFCTGGIRCEKAALYLLNQGYKDVYQLEGGILNYFAKVGGAHYAGDCYVFDERIALKPNLTMATTKQCAICQAPVTETEQALPAYVPGVSCPSCA
ncbi:sulfurtransferase [Aquicella lusitana]|uniref:tRNA uridine(34) hydroxylase n=1 Tax=Aquicella lusitana TaxID=254246 RepID=A0A370GRQ6_9COXI|nr:sulfurtransferase [Aquicella lusitana]RDI46089.1 UPF0176 protein [Aquicella lusitana]VVC73314.1 putative adenylyltransferase/sulfurtransferase MoeZ [Aquicella lusitana]